MDVEQDYLDVLQNIEAAIQAVYRNHAQLLDYDVEWALNLLIQHYQREHKTGNRTDMPIADPLKQTLYTAVRGMCEWRMGRETSDKPPDAQEIPASRQIDLEVTLACLKRIRKSVQTWTKREGRQGYLNFTSEFV